MFKLRPGSNVQTKQKKQLLYLGWCWFASHCNSLWGLRTTAVTREAWWLTRRFEMNTASQLGGVGKKGNVLNICELELSCNSLFSNQMLLNAAKTTLCSTTHAFVFWLWQFHSSSIAIVWLWYISMGVEPQGNLLMRCSLLFWGKVMVISINLQVLTMISLSSYMIDNDLYQDRYCT